MARRARQRLERRSPPRPPLAGRPQDRRRAAAAAFNVTWFSLGGRLRPTRTPQPDSETVGLRLRLAAGWHGSLIVQPLWAWLCCTRLKNQISVAGIISSLIVGMNLNPCQKKFFKIFQKNKCLKIAPCVPSHFAGLMELRSCLPALLWASLQAY